MELKKDISIKDTESKLLSIGLFKDKDISFAFKKTEKILTAIYLLTNTFPVQEELRWSMRHSGGSLLKDIHQYAQATTHAKLSSQLEETALIIHSLVSFIRIGVLALYISEMNAEILTHELFKLHETLHLYAEKHPQRNLSLGKSFFDVEALTTHDDIQKDIKDIHHKKGDLQEVEKHVLYKGHAKGHNVLERIATMHSHYQSSSNKDIHEVSPTRTANSYSQKDRNNERQDMIVEYLKHNKVLTIKDVSSFIKGCSEKTIQRDLVDLIQKGVLKKVGERRWSKYFLA